MSSRFLYLLLLVFITASHSNAYPLSTQNRWIIDEATGKRAKLVCANWAGHLQPMIPEGLDKRPLKDIVGEVVKHKFNCVRLTYAIYMWTRHAHENVSATFASLDVPEVVQGIAMNNPSVLSMTHVETFHAVVRELGFQNVKVLLDNHVSQPMWCCDDDEENGFFHDRHFNPQEWVQGLTFAAKHFTGNPAVVAMSLRNELHGPRQNLKDWYKYMSEGAVAIHKTNPNVLVLISEPNSNAPIVNILYHPLSGQCAQVNEKNEIELGSCETKNRWVRGDNNATEILLYGTEKCLTAVGEGLPVVVSDCEMKNSSWKSVSMSKLHLATMNEDEEELCLQKDSNSSTIVTSNCICIKDDSLCLDDPQSQWFQLVQTNV